MPPHRRDDGFDNDEDRRGPGQRRAPRQKANLVLLSVLLAVGGIAVLGGVFLVCILIVLGIPGRDPRLVENAPKAPQAKDAPLIFPKLGPSQMIEPGIAFQEATLQRGGMPMKVWYYRPANAPGKLPLMLVPPAGSTLACGMDLGEGDRPEHFPYARAGFAVMSFEIDGHVPQGFAADAAILKGAREFRDARAGLDNAKAAIDFILAKALDLDTNRIYVAGHSSAATLALLVAEHEPRIKACASFCGVPDVETRLGPAVADFDRSLPGFRDFIRFSSPKTHADQLKCPVFLFHALDDNNVPPRQTTEFAAQLKATNPNVRLVTTPRGGHYDSMLHEGIPMAIAWFKKLPK